MIFPPPRLLLAHHGTPGACQAEALAFDLLHGQGEMVHLWVVPDFWAGMQGDDWLNNAATRQDFASYVEKMLAEEAAQWVNRLRLRAEGEGIVFRSTVRFGEPTTEIIRLVEREMAPLVLGRRRKPGFAGFRSQVDLHQVSRQITQPLFIAPPPP